MEYPRFDLTGQVSLVTGAARGLGRAIALALAHAGSDVALGLRDANTARDLADEVQSMGRKSLSLQMDVTHLDQICRAVDKAASYFGRLDILVNNAGVAPENLAENYREEEDRKSTRLNSSHGYISYAVFCLKKKKNTNTRSMHHYLIIYNNMC